MNVVKGGPGIVKLLEVIRDQNTSETSMVMEYIDNHNISLKNLSANFTDFDIRFYMYQLLKAIDYANARGIWHRDIKPDNFIIDHPNRKFTLLDWGLAEFYIPNKEYFSNTGSRYYKAPELLLGM